MLSKSNIKWINSLERKKNRDEEGLFVAEGGKLVAELLQTLKCSYLATSQHDFYETYSYIANESDLVSLEEYKKISFQKSPQGVLAVFEKPVHTVDLNEVCNQLNLVLDDVQDPGNLGTMIRLADWFGIETVFCSLHTADAYSPKAIQSTMGAIGRVQVHYVNLHGLLREVKGKTPIYGTFMEGSDIYQENLSKNGLIIMGNEGNGISEELLPFVSEKLMIPTFSQNEATSESLNVGIAAAIVISEFRRQATF